ncbi:MAG TPA: hypothetical protein DCL54_18280 [Alphaproteobacteria bacterium]|nr:hypothetical protein [Alphaproteobacteria bacterium]HAJ48529.1 hypothetical protein [Alphaproteobacteria bacterium]
MSNSTNLQMPLLAAAQAQKHVTVNSALQKLDLLVQLGVQSRTLAAPPVNPTDGSRYIVAAAPTGAWAGQAGKVAAWQDGVWTFLTPRAGWTAWVEGENRLVFHDGANWIESAGNLTLATLTAAKVTAGSGAYVVLDTVKASAGDPASPQEGMLVINTTDNAVRLYADGGWRTLASW